jgi:F-type H+-transporting ATPase subunit delta
MKISAKQYATALLSECQDTPQAEWPKIIDTFLSLLAVNGELARWPAIEAELEKLDNEQNKVLPVQLISSRPLSEASLQDLTLIIKKESGAEQLTWQSSIDPTLLGGAIVKYGDRVLDLSASGQLQRLASELKS